MTPVITPSDKGEASKYRDPRADGLRARRHGIYGGEEISVPVEAIAEDLLGLGVLDVPVRRCRAGCRPAAGTRSKRVRYRASLPEDIVRAAAADRDPAARFEVTPEAMRWRLYSFGLAEPPPT